MTYTETLDKISQTIGHEAALTLILNAEDYGQQSLNGVVVIAEPVPDSLRYTYDIYTEA